MNRIRPYFLEIALVLSAIATFIDKDSTGQVHTIAGYVTAALAAVVVAVRGPAVAKKAKKHVVKHVIKHRQKKAIRKAKRAHPPRHTDPKPGLKLPAFGIDWAWGNLTPEQLNSVGVKWVARYLSTDPSKNLTPAESDMLHQAGFKRVVVWETTASRATQGQAAGEADARAALAQARDCGLPEDGDWAIFFAVDFEAEGPEIAEYFRGVRLVLDKHTGVYAGYQRSRTCSTTVSSTTPGKPTPGAAGAGTPKPTCSSTATITRSSVSASTSTTPSPEACGWW